MGCANFRRVKETQGIIMKILKILLVIASTLFLFACSHQQPNSHDSKGNPIYLKNYLGRWVVINFWAPWCKPCLHEIPGLNRLYQKNKIALVVLGVSYDNLSNQKINMTIKKYAIHYPMLSTLKLAQYGIHKISTLPTTFIINPGGKLTKTLKGPHTTAQFAKAIGITHRGS
jgi:thiol-disulfide isomerase/thioredoxin